MILVRRGRTIALAGAILLALTACGGGGPKVEEPTGPTLATVKADLDKAGSYQYNVTVQLKGGGWSAVERGTVAVGTVGGKPASHATVKVDFSGSHQQKKVPLEVIDIGGQVYVKVPDVAPKPKPGVITFDTFPADMRIVEMVMSAPVLDFRQYLAVTLEHPWDSEASSEPTTLAGATVAGFGVGCNFGADCTVGDRLSAWLDSHAPSTPSLSFTALADPDTGRLKKFTAEIFLLMTDGNGAHVTIGADLKDIGKPVTITAPKGAKPTKG
jgi:hypothetical protein